MTDDTAYEDDTCSQEPNRTGGRFAPGVSGNPGGRSPTRLADGRTLRDIARDHTEPAIDTLAKTMNDERAPAPARIAAAMALLDRGWGKPAQYVETVDLTRAASIDPAEIPARLAALFAAVQRRKDAAEAGEE